MANGAMTCFCEMMLLKPTILNAVIPFSSIGKYNSSSKNPDQLNYVLHNLADRE